MTRRIGGNTNRTAFIIAVALLAQALVVLHYCVGDMSSYLVSSKTVVKEEDGHTIDSTIESAVIEDDVPEDDVAGLSPQDKDENADAAEARSPIEEPFVDRWSRRFSASEAR